MGVALQLPKAYPLKQWRSLAVLLGPVMLLMWLCSGLLVYLILGLPFWEAMLLGAVITPTDPVVSTSLPCIFSCCWAWRSRGTNGWS